MDNYGTAAGSQRGEVAQTVPSLTQRALETRESLMFSRNRLEAMLVRLRGHNPPSATIGAKGIDMPDPDHVNFTMQSNVSLAGEICALLGELETYI